MPAFVYVIIGGMGSSLGAVARWLTHRCCDQRNDALSFRRLAKSSMYILMAVIFSIRPRGLFGEEGIFG